MAAPNQFSVTLPRRPARLNHECGAVANRLVFLRQVRNRGVAPPRIAGQFLRDAIMEALASQGLPDIGRDARERVGKLCLKLLQGCLGGVPLGGELVGDPFGPGREPYLLAASVRSGPGGQTALTV